VLEAIEHELRRRSREVEADEWNFADAPAGSERTSRRHSAHFEQCADGL
jgi:hypothetical protein